MAITGDRKEYVAQGRHQLNTEAAVAGSIDIFVIHSGTDDDTHVEVAAISRCSSV
jgi:hypothetical protein